jgi:hypothetical protein
MSLHVLEVDGQVAMLHLMPEKTAGADALLTWWGSKGSIDQHPW